MRHRVLFLYQLPSPFILQDRALLENHASVVEFQWFGRAHPARDLAAWMARHRREYDLVFIWFGDAHATIATRIARILGKPSVVVAGGYDVSDMPGYGFLSTPSKRKKAAGHFGRATRILASSEAVRVSLLRAFPGLAAKSEVLYLGVDANRFRPGSGRERRVLTVAGAESWQRALVKGWDRVSDVARLLPDLPFTIVGAGKEVAKRLRPPPNLEILSPCPGDDLIRHYQRTAVYLQASRSEAMSCALMEAMACGCTPVATMVGGMPELVGGAGFLTSEDVPSIAAAVRQALDAPDCGAKAREVVVQRFSLAQREQRLAGLVEELVQGHRRRQPS